MTVSSDPLPATGLSWLRSGSSSVYTVVAKATFRLQPGEAALAAEQEPISEGDGHWDDNPVRSLFIPTDLVPMKSRVDVMVVGHAFAPQGTRVRSLVARLGFGAIDKAIELFSDRTLGHDGAVYEAASFARMPLVYERAAGGPGTWNPVGLSREDRDRNGNIRLPNLQAVGAPPTSKLDPVGFGPIAPTWPTRAERVRYPGPFVTGEWPKRPLPDGFDVSFFQVAPLDQQLDALPADMLLALENLNAEHPRLACRLPTLLPIASFELRGARGPEIPMHADTLWIDTDRALCTLTYRAQTAVDRPDGVTARVSLSAQAAPGRVRGSTPTGMFTNDAGQALPFGRSQERKTVAGPSGTSPPVASSPLGEETQTGLAGLAETAGPEWVDRAMRELVGADSSRIPGTPFANQFSGARAQPASRSQARTVQQPAVDANALSAPARPVPPPPPSNSGVTASNVSPVAAPSFGFAPPSAPPPLAPGPPPPDSPPPTFGAPSFTPVTPTAAARADSPWAAGASSRSRQPQHAQGAALLGVTSASNAAADPSVVGGPGAVRRGRATAFDLLWFHTDLLPRVRRKREWRDLIDELEQTAHDPELDAPGPGDSPADIEDRREIMHVLARGVPSTEAGVDASLDGAVRSDGRFAAPLVLVSGELALEFDELETLRAVVSIATPLATGDEDLKASIDAATAYLGVPNLVPSPETVKALTARIREAFAKGKRAVPGTYLDSESERALLEKRAFQTRDVFGAKHLRGSFFFGGSTTGVPTYLPELLGKKLPLFRRIPMRIIADVVFQADQFESHPTALLSGAVARVVRGTI